MRDSLVGQRLVWVFLLGVVLFNDPLLTLFDRGRLVAGIPLVYLYLFAAWCGLIGLLAWILAAGDAERRAERDASADAAGRRER